MDEETSRIYEHCADAWIGARRPQAVLDGRLDAFAERLSAGGRVGDLGCGPGWYAAAFAERGFRALALDGSHAMLRAAQKQAELPCVQGDLARLPFGRESLDGAFAINCYCHLPCSELPAALAQLHATLQGGAPVELTLARLENFELDLDQTRRGEAELRMESQFPGRLFSIYSEARARALLEGAGFEQIELAALDIWHVLRARRARTLPDFVRPGLRILICGLNPSLYAADAGVPFARPGNRFWPAAARLGLDDGERDPYRALERGVGFTDLVKRATRRASELRAEEYRAGLARVEALVRSFQPGVVCFVGLDGYRKALDPKARPGPIASGFAGQPAYLMPSTSGLNAHSRLDDLVTHLERALAETDNSASSGRTSDFL